MSLGSPAIRLGICLVVALVFSIFPGAIVVYIMLLLALASVRFRANTGEVNAALVLIVLMQSIYTLLAFTVYLFRLNPIQWTPTRGGVVDDEAALMVVFGAAQFLFILSAILRSRSRVDGFNNRDRRVFRIAALLIVIVASILINPGRDFFSGEYQGQVASYPGFMPAIFVISLSAWILLQRKYGIGYFIILNTIVGWWLINGNRSEVLIGFVFGNYLFLKNLVPNDRRFRALIYTCGGVMTFAVFSFVGYFRVYGLLAFDEFGFLRLFAYMIDGDRLQVQTFGAAIYSAMVAVHHAADSGLLYGETILGQIINTLPSMIPVPWTRYVDVTEGLRDYQLIGGLGFVGEGFLNFGVIGPALMAYGLATIFLQLKYRVCTSFLASWFLLSLVLYGQRFILYGFVYFYNTLSFFLVLYVCREILKAKRFNRAKDSINLRQRSPEESGGVF